MTACTLVAATTDKWVKGRKKTTRMTAKVITCPYTTSNSTVSPTGHANSDITICHYSGVSPIYASCPARGKECEICHKYYTVRICRLSKTKKIRWTCSNNPMGEKERRGEGERGREKVFVKWWASLLSLKHTGAHVKGYASLSMPVIKV